jgi:pimeloyl-ACP methyl ester carboxylesterase
MTAEHDASLTLPDGRTLSYATFGPAAGPLVVVLDGPGSRGLARAAAPAARELGIRLVAPDRPGWFASTPAPDRAIGDWPADHAALLDALGAEPAGLLAQSGGTPYALAVAAALPERTTALAFCNACGPLSDPENLADAGKQLRSGAKLARRAPWLLKLALKAGARSVRKNPEKAARKVITDDMPTGDRAILDDPALWALHVQATGEILGRPEAVAQEIGLLSRPWGVDLAAVDVPVRFWSGELDAVHPTPHSRRLAAAIGGAPAVEVVPGAAVFGMLAIYPDALRFASQAGSKATGIGSAVPA